MVLMSFVVVLALVSMAQASLRMSTGPFMGIDLYSPPITSYLGPQFDPLAVPITAPLVHFTGGACRASQIPRNLVHGRIVFSSGLANENLCSYETLYENFEEKGAVALVTMYRHGIQSTPGAKFYQHDGRMGYGLKTPGRMPLLYIKDQLTLSGNELFSEFLLVTKTPLIARITPDDCPFARLHTSTLFEVACRWIPAAIYTMVAFLAAVFLVQHSIYARRRLMPRMASSRPNGLSTSLSTQRVHIPIRAMLAELRIPHLVLAIELLTGILFAILIGGYELLTTPTLPKPFVQAMNTQLMGLSFTCDLLAAMLWTQKLSELRGLAVSPLARLITNRCVKYAILVIPLLFDIAMSIAYYLWLDYYVPYLDMTIHIVLAALQFAIGVHFLVQAKRFRDMVKTSVEATVGNIQASASDPLILFLHRFQRWTTLLAISMMLVIAIIPLRCTKWVFNPTPWAIYWIVFANARALTSVCRVLMFRPQAPSKSSFSFARQVLSRFTCASDIEQASAPTLSSRIASATNRAVH